MTRLALLALVLAACGEPDPCDGVAGTCLALRVSSPTIDRVDRLAIDVLDGEVHSTATIDPGASLPLVTSITLADPVAVEVGVVVAGLAGTRAVGTGAASTTIGPGDHASLTVELRAPLPCDDGELYCGATQVAGDDATLYRCNAGDVPTARGRCAAGCMVTVNADDACRAADDGQPGGCTETGLYCGGDEVVGDPQALYRCTSGRGVFVRACNGRCVIEQTTDDHCQ